MGHDVDHVYLVEVGLLVEDHVAEVICILENVFGRVDEHLELARNQNLQGYQKDVFLLVKYHGHVSKS